jgi:hypothetical protein
MSEQKKFDLLDRWDADSDLIEIEEPDKEETTDSFWVKEGRYSYAIRTSTKKVEVKPNFDFTNKLSSYSILVSDIKGSDLMNTKLYDVKLSLNEAKIEAEKYL